VYSAEMILGIVIVVNRRPAVPEFYLL